MVEFTDTKEPGLNALFYFAFVQPVYIFCKEKLLCQSHWPKIWNGLGFAG